MQDQILPSGNTGARVHLSTCGCRLRQCAGRRVILVVGGQQCSGALEVRVFVVDAVAAPLAIIFVVVVDDFSAALDRGQVLTSPVPRHRSKSVLKLKQK